MDGMNDIPRPSRRDVVGMLLGGVAQTVEPDKARADSLTTTEQEYFDWAVRELSLPTPNTPDVRERHVTEVYSRIRAADEANAAILGAAATGEEAEPLLLGGARIVRDDLQKDVFRGMARFQSDVRGQPLFVQLNIVVRGEAGTLGSIQRCSVVFSSNPRIGALAFAVDWTTSPSSRFQLSRHKADGFSAGSWVPISGRVDEAATARLFDGVLARVAATG